jgi:hypothetical protein
VDLPAALGPVMPSTCPASSVKLRLLTVNLRRSGGPPETPSNTSLPSGLGSGIVGASAASLPKPLSSRP